MTPQYVLKYRSSSFHKVRAMLGHGLLMTSLPLSAAGTFLPSSLTTSMSTPKSGRPVAPGFEYEAPGNVVSMMLPVSVCHHVSTMGHLLLPISRWYQVHASGLIGSPTK